MSFSGCLALNLIPTNWANKGVQGLPGAFLVTFCAYKKLPGSGLGRPGRPRAASDLFGSTQVCGRKVDAAAGGREAAWAGEARAAEGRFWPVRKQPGLGPR